MDSNVSVEKPPHADPLRIRHIDTDGLLAALGPGSSQQRVAELLAYVANRQQPWPIPRLRERLRGVSQEERLRIDRAARAAADRPATAFVDRGLGRSALYGYHYLGWATALLENYVLTDEVRWLHTWGEVFEQWYASRDLVRGDWPGLDVVWCSLGVACRLRPFIDALDVGGAELPESTRLRLLGSILGHARWLADEHDAFRYGNWQLVAACSLLVVAALFPEFEESARWAERARLRIEEHLALDVYDDGGHSERAPSYHRLCLVHLQDAALHAEAYLDWRLRDDPRLAAMHEWLIRFATPEGWLPPFQDSGLIQVGPELVRGHQLTDRHELFAYLPGSKYVVSRSGWSAGSLYAAVNCGPLIPHELESHSHQACLDFVLWGYGTPLAWEAGGPDSYDDPSYHDWFQAADAHNTVIVDGVRCRPDRDGTVELAAHHACVDVVVAHHDGWGARHRRTFVFVRPSELAEGYWYVTDELGGGRPWRWQLHGVRPWEPLHGTGFVASSGPGLLVALPNAADASYELGEGVTSVPSGDRSTNRSTLYGLTVRPRLRRLDAVLVPFGVRPPEDLTVANRGRVIQVARNGVVDELDSRSWSRWSGGRLAAAACWNGGAVRSAETGGVVLAAPRSRTAYATWHSEGVSAEVTSTHRTEVQLAAGSAGEVRVCGVAVPFSVRRGVVAVDLPRAGTWDVEVVTTS